MQKKRLQSSGMQGYIGFRVKDQARIWKTEIQLQGLARRLKTSSSALAVRSAPLSPWQWDGLMNDIDMGEMSRAPSFASKRHRRYAVKLIFFVDTTYDMYTMVYLLYDPHI